MQYLFQKGKTMKKIIISLLLFITIFSSALASGSFEQLKIYIDNNDYANTGKLLRKILHSDDMPNLKAWIKCAEVFEEKGKNFTSLTFFEITKAKFEFISDIIDPVEIGLNEKEIEAKLKKNIQKLYKKLKIKANAKFFNFDNEQELEDNAYYLYLAETMKIADETVAPMLPLPYTISELAATIEDHLEEFADMNEEAFEKESEGYESEGMEEFNEDDYEEYVEEPDYPSPDEIFEVDEDPSVDLEEIIRNIKYPSQAVKKKIEGVVIINVLVGADGIPVKCLIIETDNKILNQAAIDAIMKTKFSPALIDNEPVASWVDIPVEFKLE